MDDNSRSSNYLFAVIKWTSILLLGLAGVIVMKGLRLERQGDRGIHDGASVVAMSIRPSRIGMTGPVNVAIITAVCLMVLGVSIIGLDLSEALTSALLVGVAVTLAVIGVFLWSSDSAAQGSRSNLGAALLGSAVVTFAVFGFQLADARKQAELEQKYQDASIKLQSASNKIDTQLVKTQQQAIQLQAQAIQAQRQIASIEAALGKRQLATQQGNASTSALQHRQLTLVLQDDLSGIDLRNQDLSGYYLRNKTLTGANLAGADLSGANLQGTNLIDANLRGANLKGSVANAATQWPRGFDAKTAGVIYR